MIIKKILISSGISENILDTKNCLISNSADAIYGNISMRYANDFTCSPLWYVWLSRYKNGINQKILDMDAIVNDMPINIFNNSNVYSWINRQFRWYVFSGFQVICPPGTLKWRYAAKRVYQNAMIPWPLDHGCSFKFKSH